MRLVQILAVLVTTVVVSVVYAQSDPAIEGRWGRDARTLLDLEASTAGAVTGDVYFSNGGPPVRVPIGTGKFDRASGALLLEGQGVLPGTTTSTTWVIRGPLVEPTLNVDLSMGALQTTAALTRMPRPQALGPGTVLITGGNRGLGLEFARQYAANGWTVIATARDPEAAADLRD